MSREDAIVELFCAHGCECVGSLATLNRSLNNSVSSLDVLRTLECLRHCGVALSHFSGFPESSGWSTGCFAGRDRHTSEPPRRTAVRTFSRILVEDGHLTQRKVGREMYYKPTRARKRAGQSALMRVVETFFDGSAERAFAAHLAGSNADMSDEELKKLAALIRGARKKGR